MLRAIKPISRIPSRGTNRPTPRLINSCKKGLRVLKGLNCLGIEVRNASTKRLTVVASQIVVASGITTNRPAIRSFLRSCWNRSFRGWSDLGLD